MAWHRVQPIDNTGANLFTAANPGKVSVDVDTVTASNITIRDGTVDTQKAAVSETGALSVALTGSLTSVVTLQDEVVAADNGTPYSPTAANMTLTFTVTGTSTSRTVNFEIAKAGGVFVVCQCLNIANNTFATSTTGGTDAAPEHWQVAAPAGYSFRARVSAVAGGNVSVAGEAAM